jgi:hypothetical protein
MHVYFVMHPIPNVNKYTAVTNLQVPHIVPELQQSENLLLYCNVLKELVKKLVVKLQHTDF